MATNPLGSSTRNISSNVPTDIYIAIHKLAMASGITVSKYVRAIVEFAAAKNILVRENPDSRLAYYEAVRTNSPLPEIAMELVFDTDLESSAMAAEPPAPYIARRNQKK